MIVCRGNNRSTRWNRPKSLVGSHCIKIALPFELSSEPANRLLFAQTHNGSKSKLHSLALCPQTREPEGFLHQLVVNDYVRSHSVYPRLTLYTFYQRAGGSTTQFHTEMRLCHWRIRYVIHSRAYRCDVRRSDCARRHRDPRSVDARYNPIRGAIGHLPTAVYDPRVRHPDDQ